MYSRKLHMRVRRERTSAVTSLTILALSLGLRVENHFARRCGGGERATRGDESGWKRTTLPCRDRRIRYLDPVSDLRPVGAAWDGRPT